MTDWRKQIGRKADVLGGEPVVGGTRVPVRVLVGGLADGMSLEGVSAIYCVSIDDVRAAPSYAADALIKERAFGIRVPRLSWSTSACLPGRQQTCPGGRPRQKIRRTAITLSL